jgi:hypothetical protein
MRRWKGIFILTDNSVATASQAVYHIKVAHSADRPNTRWNIGGGSDERHFLDKIWKPCFKTGNASTTVTV